MSIDAGPGFVCRYSCWQFISLPELAITPPITSLMNDRIHRKEWVTQNFRAIPFQISAINHKVSSFLPPFFFFFRKYRTTNCSFQRLDNLFWSFDANELEIRLIKCSFYLMRRRLLVEMFTFIRKRIKFRPPSDSKTGFFVRWKILLTSQVIQIGRRTIFPSKA